MSAHGTPQSSSAELVQRELATADRRRRGQDASRAFWHLAPFAAAVCLVFAAATRWQGWSAALPLGALGIAALILVARVVFARRAHTFSDAVAARIDEAAGLGGELRSAGWFASRDTRDSWTDHHLDRAARRLGDFDWRTLYPPTRAPRAKTVTAVLAVSTVALAMLLPGRESIWPGASAKAAAAHALRAKEMTDAELLLPEVQKELEALLAAAETGTAAPGGTPMTATELRSLINRLNALRDAGRLKDLARAMAPPGAGSDEPSKEMTAISERAKKAAQMPTVAPEVRDTLQKVADDMSDAAMASKPPGENPSETTSSKNAQKSDANPGKEGGDVDEASITSISEAEAGGGAGIIMMGSKDEASGKSSPGIGMGGGSAERTDGGSMADLEAALRRETIEASTDNGGQNVQTEARRKTEHGQATVTYANSAAGTFDRGRAVAPPPVPESRRAAVQTYFIRPQ